jgi:hypothetical protein
VPTSRPDVSGLSLSTQVAAMSIRDPGLSALVQGVVGSEDSSLPPGPSRSAHLHAACAFPASTESPSRRRREGARDRCCAPRERNRRGRVSDSPATRVPTNASDRRTGSNAKECTQNLAYSTPEARSAELTVLADTTYVQGGNRFLCDLGQVDAMAPGRE